MRLDHCRLAHGDLADGRCAWCGLPLPARHSRWCSIECSRAWAENHQWTQARHAALVRDGWKCVRCGEPEDLEVHHIVPVRRPGGYGMGCQHHLDNLETLCFGHHREAHRLLREDGPVQLSLLPA